MSRLERQASPGPTTRAWHRINWAAWHRRGRSLQRRIVQAVQAGAWRKGKRLSSLLVHSLAARALAVKRVTEHPGRPPPRTPALGEPRTVAVRGNAVSTGALGARSGGGHRGRRPDQADTGRARELGSASSASGLACAEHEGVHRASKAHVGKARGPAGSLHLAKRGDDRDGGTSGSAKERRTGERQSSRRRVARAATPRTANAYANAAGPRQPGEPCARAAAGPGSQ